jgi:site-specific DNA recombinase
MSMLNYVNYTRKSSEDEDRQVLSIEAQDSELSAIAANNSLRVVKTFSESKSAKEPGREIFNEMLRAIERGEANAILTWKLDRLARNFDDGGKLIGMLQRGVIKEIRTFEKSYFPQDNVLTIAVEFGMANQYVRDLVVNIRRGNREKIRRGIFTGKAPLGYYNEPKLRTIEPHPDRFDKVKAILELFATGRYTLTALQQKLTASGFLSKSGKPLPLSSVGNLLTNPFYYGVFVIKGEMHPGSHVPMISKKQFDAIQAAMVAVGKPRTRATKREFQFLNFAVCGSCGYCITGERHTKKSGRQYHYYRCTHKNKKQHCDDRSFMKDDLFAAEVKRNTELASIPDEWTEKFLARIETWETDFSHEKEAKILALKSELAATKSKIDRINNAFAEGAFEVEEFRELKNPLIPLKAGLEQQIVALERSRSNRLEPLRNFILRANTALKWIQEDNWLEMKSFLQNVGSNRLLRAQTLTVEFIKPAQLLAETNIAVRSTSDVSEQISKWWTRGELNPRPKSTHQPRLHA